MTYAELKLMVRGYINRTDLSEDFLASSINMGIQKLQRQLRLPFMERQANTTLTAGTNKATIIGDYLELINIWVDGRPLERKSLDYVTGLQDNGGTPEFFARLGGEWVFYPTPRADVDVSILYYGEFTPLVNPTDTNTLLRISSDAVLWATLAFLGEYFEDTRTDRWNAKMQEVINELELQAQDQEISGSTLAINYYD